MRKHFRGTTVNPFVAIIFAVCEPHRFVMHGSTFAEACDQLDFGRGEYDRCPRGMCHIVQPEQISVHPGYLASYTNIFHSFQMLTQRQKDALKRHAAHHTKAHMDYMRRRMHAGDSFSEAHRKAQQQGGK